MRTFLPPTGVLCSGNLNPTTYNHKQHQAHAVQPLLTRIAQLNHSACNYRGHHHSRHHSIVAMALMAARLVADAAQPSKRQPRDWTCIHVGRLKLQIASLVSAERQSDLRALACVAKSRRTNCRLRALSPAHQRGLLLEHPPFSLYADHGRPAAPEHWVQQGKNGPPGKQSDMAQEHPAVPVLHNMQRCDPGFRPTAWPHPYPRVACPNARIDLLHPIRRIVMHMNI